MAGRPLYMRGASGRTSGIEERGDISATTWEGFTLRLLDTGKARKEGHRRRSHESASPVFHYISM